MIKQCELYYVLQTLEFYFLEQRFKIGPEQLKSCTNLICIKTNKIPFKIMKFVHRHMQHLNNLNHLSKNKSGDTV